MRTIGPSEIPACDNKMPPCNRIPQSLNTSSIEIRIVLVSAKWGPLDGNKLRLAQSIMGCSTGKTQATATRAIWSGPSSWCCMVLPLVYVLIEFRHHSFDKVMVGQFAIFPLVVIVFLLFALNKDEDVIDV
ncbi:hypothetical protein HAX54_016376 [Datura stramonium]|uniref:Uncharacterized protein n=1 Tax=Datura stramonium TaxID=4076 RepID=A0ABS8S047_DATST|nr:hypothetical protein [Datura stramonium]